MQLNKNIQLRSYLNILLLTLNHFISWEWIFVDSPKITSSLGGNFKDIHSSKRQAFVYTFLRKSKYKGEVNKKSHSPMNNNNSTVLQQCFEWSNLSKLWVVSGEDREVLNTYPEVYIKMMTKISPINPHTVVKMNVTESNSFVSNITQYKIWESVLPPALQFAWGVGGNLIALIVLVKTVKSHK